MVKLMMLMAIVCAQDYPITPDAFSFPKEQTNQDTDILFIALCGHADSQKAIDIVQGLMAQGHDIEIINAYGDDASRKKAYPYKLVRVPTYIVRTNNKEVARIVGLQPEPIYFAVVTTIDPELYRGETKPIRVPRVPSIGRDTDILYIQSWCPACKDAKKIIKRLQKEGYDVIIVKETRPDIVAIPTLIVRIDGEEVDRLTGLQTAQAYRQYISKLPESDLPIPAPCQEPIDLDAFTGAVNFTNGTEPRTLVYRGIVKRARRGIYGYAEYNPDDQPDLVEKYEITKLPTLLLLKQGVEIGRYVGITPL